MMVHDFDDEQTMEEEEAYSNAESGTNELDDLQKVSSFVQGVTKYVVNSVFSETSAWIQAKFCGKLPIRRI